MDTRTITVNDKNYTFTCASARNRSGFTHDCEMRVDGKVFKCHAQYYNRTWEPYTYHSVMSGALYQYRSSVEAGLKKDFMEAHDYKKLVGNRKAEFESFLAENETIKELDTVKDELRQGTWW